MKHKQSVNLKPNGYSLHFTLVQYGKPKNMRSVNVGDTPNKTVRYLKTTEYLSAHQLF